MRHLKDNRGFTLVELIVSIASATVVLGAASMLLLMCVRTQRDVLDAAREQQTARTVIAMMENLASDGTIQKVVIPVPGDEGYDEDDAIGWILKDSEDSEVLTYYSGEGKLTAKSGVLLEGLNTAHATINGQIFDFSFETDLGSYSTSVYCRLLDAQVTDNGNVKPVEDAIIGVDDSGGNVDDVKGLEEDVNRTARFEFLKTLIGEYGSTGMISGGGGSYAKWYEPSWADNTPWCACYLSWAAAQQFGLSGEGSELHTSKNYIFADVDDGWRNMTTIGKTDTPVPGDYIFFDWEAFSGIDADGQNDPDHVGAVLYVANGIVYTIEGNSGNRVAIRSYSLSDPRILGYGVLPW